MNLLFVHENLSYGGGEKMFFWVAKKMKERGHDVQFCFMYNCVQYKSQDITPHCLNLRFSASYLYRNMVLFTLGAYRLFKFIKTGNYKNIVCFGFNSFFILSVIKPILHFKLFVSERGDPMSKRFSSIRNYFFAKSDYVIFQTEGARKLMPSVRHCSVIPNPINLPKEIWNDNAANEVIINVGRLDIEQKRQDLLIYAFNYIHSLFPSYKLKLVGNGGDMGRLSNIVNQLNLSDYVVFEGFKKDVIKELLASKIFVLSSDFEGIPNALLEAMSLGMPVVSTKCSPGGAEFLITDYDNGLLAEKGDYKSLANAIIYMISNVNKRKIMAQKSRLSVIPFSEERISQLWENCMNEVFDHNS